MGLKAAYMAALRPIGGYTGSVDGFLPIFFLLVVLKIPVFGALWLVWWASKPPETEETHDGGSGEDFNRWRPLPTRPRGPQHGPGQAGCAERERLRSRRISRM